MKGTTKSPELVETKMQTSGGKFQWFCHQLSIEQALMFPSLSPYMAQNYTRITTVLLLLPTCSLFQSILNRYHFLVACLQGFL